MLCFAAAGTAARAQSMPAAAEPASIAGVVVDAASGLPLAGATVIVVDRDARAVTDAAGRFRLARWPRRVPAAIERPGYQPAVSDELALIAGGDAAVTLSLSARRPPKRSR